MMNDVILVPASDAKEPNPLQVSKTPQNKEAVVINLLPGQKKLPAPLKDIPVSKWIMPPEQHGYIQGNDRDCL